ncbi:MFS transporter [Paenibacillus koleovorans]|uniref:MFS transporter n=1 Tax=Paenibacillus koleovorans TaxID=121608 RepID=UPI000FD91BF6|nr:MFS transporter [Paenibacillus koleovorans]
MTKTAWTKLIALITAVCVMSDSMLYIVLPVYGSSFGLTELWQVGVLLSANRFVRLPLNPLAGWLYRRLGLRACMLSAIGIALLSTLGYGLVPGFWLLLLARCFWGVAWTLLRLGGYLTILEASDNTNRGQMLGTYNGLWGLGSLVGMLAGGVLADEVGVRPVLIGMSALIFVCWVLAYRFLPDLQVEPPTAGASTLGGLRSSRRLSWLDPATGFVLGSGLLVAAVFYGVLPSTLSRLIEERSFHYTIWGLTFGAAALSGVLQGLRAGLSPFLSPWFGRQSDGPWGRKPWIAAAMAAGASFMLLLPWPRLDFALWLICLLTALLVNTALFTLMDAAAADRAALFPNARVTIMTSYTMLFDLGSALGPLTGYVLIDIIGLGGLYASSGITLLLLAIAWAVAWRRGHKIKFTTAEA